MLTYLLFVFFPVNIILHVLFPGADVFESLNENGIQEVLSGAKLPSDLCDKIDRDIKKIFQCHE